MLDTTMVIGALLICLIALIIWLLVRRRRKVTRPGRDFYVINPDADSDKRTDTEAGDSSDL